MKKPPINFDLVGAYSLFSLWEVAYKYSHPEHSHLSSFDLLDYYGEDSTEEIVMIILIYDLAVGYSDKFLRMYVNEG